MSKISDCCCKPLSFGGGLSRGCHVLAYLSEGPYNQNFKNCLAYKFHCVYHFLFKAWSWTCEWQMYPDSITRNLYLWICAFWNHSFYYLLVVVLSEAKLPWVQIFSLPFMLRSWTSYLTFLCLSVLDVWNWANNSLTRLFVAVAQNKLLWKFI